jgi:hypothetical protein
VRLPPITITLPEQSPAERAALLRMTVAELIRGPRAAPAPARPAREPGKDEPEPEHRAMKDGKALYRWIMDQPDAEDLRKQAQRTGKLMGIGWKISEWDGAQASRVHARLAGGREVRP